MTEREDVVLEKYILTMRMIQPARIQDIIQAYPNVWGDEMTEPLREKLRRIHTQMRINGKLVGVRRGTYVLRWEGMKLAASISGKERLLDNARLFLMKDQRRSYRKKARRYG